MAEATTHATTLTAPDISCGHCVAAIQNRIGALDGVTSVVASADTKKIDLSFDPAKVSLDKIKAELDDEGYPAHE